MTQSSIIFTSFLCALAGALSMASAKTSAMRPRACGTRNMRLPPVMCRTATVSQTLFIGKARRDNCSGRLNIARGPHAEAAAPQALRLPADPQAQALHLAGGQAARLIHRHEHRALR